MIGQKANWVNQRGVRPAGIQVSEMLQDIRLEPRITGAAALALVDQCPPVWGNAKLVGYQSTGRCQLPLVIAVPRHRGGNAVRGKRNMHLVAASGRESVQ